MSGWTAILPLKLSADRKSRLAPVLSGEERQRLGDHMARHVISQLRAVAAVADIIMLSPRSIPDWPIRHVLDHGRGLNAELYVVAATVPNKILIIHGDLPLVTAQDITALVDAAEAKGCAIAPDRHGQGTNALALCTRREGFSFAFGVDSFARHQNSLGDALATVQRTGLSCDIDTPDDLAYAQTQNYKLSD